MRKPLIFLLLAVSSSADAAPLLAADSIRAAVEAAMPLQTVACVRYGWRGFGAYPGCFRWPYPPEYVVAQPYYAPAPDYVQPPRRCWIAGAWRPC